MDVFNKFELMVAKLFVKENEQLKNNKIPAQEMSISRVIVTFIFHSKKLIHFDWIVYLHENV